MKTTRQKWQCTECRAHWFDDKLLTAANPFDPEALIVGCPTCKSVECFVEICDEVGCNQPSTCGTPTQQDGYRRTCGKHRPATAP